MGCCWASVALRPPVDRGSGDGSRAWRPASPQIERLGGVGLEGQLDLAAGAGGFIGREEHLQHRAGILAGDQRLSVVSHAVHEVGHLLDEAVVPDLLVDREGPALRGAGLLHGVVVAYGTVGLDGVSVQEIGIGHALGPVHLRTVVHAAHLRPAFLGHRHHAVGELQDQDGVVIALGLVPVHGGAHLGIDRRDRAAARASSGRTRWRGSPCPSSRRPRNG